MVFYKHVPINTECISSELDILLTDTPDWRRQYALSYSFPIDRYLCLKSYSILYDLLVKHYSLTEAPKFLFNEFGKPYLADHPDIHFNISHCHKGILCAVGDEPVGADVEIIQYDEELARIVLSKSELDNVLLSDSPDIAFTEYWTRKESTFKLIGTGMDDKRFHTILYDYDLLHKMETDDKNNTVFCISIFKDDSRHTDNRIIQEN